MDAAAILALLVNVVSTIQTLTPEIEAVIAVAQKVISGTAVTEADFASLQSVQATLDAQVAAAAAKVEG